MPGALNNHNLQIDKYLCIKHWETLAINVRHFVPHSLVYPDSMCAILTHNMKPEGGCFWGGGLTWPRCHLTLRVHARHPATNGVSVG